MPKDWKWLRYRFEVTVIFVTQSIAPLEPQEDDEDDLGNEERESIVPGNASIKFEEGGQDPLNELQKVNLVLDEEPQPTFINENMFV